VATKTPDCATSGHSSIPEGDARNLKDDKEEALGWFGLDHGILWCTCFFFRNLPAGNGGVSSRCVENCNDGANAWVVVGKLAQQLTTSKSRQLMLGFILNKQIMGNYG